MYRGVEIARNWRMSWIGPTDGANLYYRKRK